MTAIVVASGPVARWLGDLLALAREPDVRLRLRAQRDARRPLAALSVT
jgi:hypothetical protein